MRVGRYKEEGEKKGRKYGLEVIMRARKEEEEGREEEKMRGNKGRRE